MLFATLAMVGDNSASKKGDYRPRNLTEAVSQKCLWSRAMKTFFNFQLAPVRSLDLPRFGALSLFFVVAAPISHCVAAPLSKKVSQSSKVSRGESYILGAGDALRVVVTGFSEFSQEAVVIPPDGTVTLPNFGTLRLSGKTRLGVQRELAAILRRKVGLRDPSIAVSITQFRSSIIGRIILAGDVPRSGSFDIREGHRLSELLADANLQTRLEEQSATLTRRGGTIALNLKAAASTPRGSADITLRPGDSITVRQIQAGRVTLSGDLEKTGVYELHAIPLGGGAMELGLQPRLSDLITKAGGLRADSAPVLSALGSAAGAVSGAARQASYSGSLQRGNQRLDLNPQLALEQISGPSNIRLRNGDVVTIKLIPPPQPLTVYLDGLSTRTGSFSMPPGSGVLELLTSAGGLTRAPSEIIASVRRGAQILPLDLSALLLSSQSGANLPLQNGDIVQLREPDVIEIQVAGRVAKPGPLRLKPGATLLEALLASGGLSVPAQDARLNVLRKEKDGTQRVLEADAAGIVGLRDISTNFALQNGDLVNIAQNATQTVFISGQIASPGSVQLREGEGLPELITRAGGARDDAALTRINVERGGKVTVVDAFDAVKAGKPLDFPMQDGDFVVIPQNLDRVLVMEAVAKPGYYPIPERGQLTLLDVLAQATPQQNTKTVLITRANLDGTVDVKQAPRTVDLDKLRKGTQPNFSLSPRDIVFVPSPKSKRSILQTLSSLSVFRLFLP